jgi:molecular chaperone DnaK
MTKDTVLGIDLGTTRTAVAKVVAGEPDIIKNSEGSEVTPSVVEISDKKATIGQPAKNAAPMNPETTVEEIKREMGADESVQVGNEEYLPEEISALILEKVVEDAEERTGSSVGKAVITVPAYFGENERSATKSAGEIAGLEVERLLPEPSAACLTYGFEKEKIEQGGQELVFVYDLGGGTFDASLVDVDYEINHFETLHTDGINELGGKDWTDEIVDWIATRAENENGENPLDNDESRRRIRDAAIEAKHTLSSKEKTQITIPFLLEGYNFDAELTRTEFAEMGNHLIEQTGDAMDDLFDRADYSVSDVDTVLLIGGSTRMQHAQQFVESYFEQEPSKEISPDHAVALGAAIQANILMKAGGAEDGNEVTGVMNASIIDVVSKSLGVELHSGHMSTVIPSDEPVPVNKRDETYTTIRDDQTIVEFPVYEGEEPIAKDNNKIGNVELGPIPPRSPDDESLAVEFTYDKDGTLDVEAEDLISGEKVDATFEAVGKHDQRGIKKMQENLPSRSD